MEIYDLYKDIAAQLKLQSNDIRKLWKIIKPICEHPEFQKRCQSPYFHHDLKTLGEHIIADTVVTYKIINSISNTYTKNIISLDTAIYIAMFHDLYELPWQNNKIKRKLPNKHAFSHPIEAITNAITWYPEYFKNKKKALKIIDGVVHHMYPLPVRRIDNYPLELCNQEKFDKLPQKYKDMIKASTNRGKIGHFSLRKSFFLEGIIMSNADKKVAICEDFKNIDGYIALVNGKNKKINELVEGEN